MRVLVVNDLPLDAGSGAEVYASRLVDGLRRAGDEVVCFAGQVRHAGAGRVLDLWDPLARRRLAAVARAFGPDVVHHHNVVRELSTSVLGVPAGVPTVLTVHDHRLLGARDQPWHGVRAVVDRAVKRPLDLAVARRRVDLAMAVSADLADRLAAAGLRRVAHVSAPVPAPLDGLPAAGAARDVLYAGRLTADKGVRELVAAWARIADRHPDSRLLVAGDGPLRRELAGERVELLGRVPPAGMTALYARARVVAVPSLPAMRPEGTPLVAVEAAVHARPVVASDDPGLAEVVTALGAGRVVPAGSVDALAAGLDAFLSAPSLADEVGRAGCGRARAAHGVDAVTRRVRDLYRSLMPAR